MLVLAAAGGGCCCCSCCWKRGCLGRRGSPRLYRKRVVIQATLNQLEQAQPVDNLIIASYQQVDTKLASHSRSAATASGAANAPPAARTRSGQRAREGGMAAPHRFDLVLASRMRLRWCGSASDALLVSIWTHRTLVPDACASRMNLRRWRSQGRGHTHTPPSQCTVQAWLERQQL